MTLPLAVRVLITAVSVLGMGLIVAQATGALRSLAAVAGQPRVPDSPGAWGPPTANALWCEADYAVTHYIAEFWNSLSSLSIIFYGVYGVRRHLKLGLSPLEPRFVLCFLIFIVVGAGSFLFYATLHREFQLLDELPMLWGNSIFMYTCFTMRDPPGTHRKGLGAAMLVATVAMSLVVTFRHHAQDLFLVFYGSGVFVLTIFGFRLARGNEGAYLMPLSFLTYAFGFILWNVERTFCPAVQSLQLHAIRHLCAGAGTYTAVLFWLFTRCKVLDRGFQQPPPVCP
eukprot:TRINITY_DN9604_c0_g1_i4.p1 TRINITY_DN9604_c0_g1~~TRINITY_DN9604_c0_g1_i4.p1  ORF type:complete len:310 (+),score=119.21 TRINITY_DN9604_c0_g1_i4:81-932(+)